MTFIEIKSIIERKLVNLKQGYLTDSKVWEAVLELQDLTSQEQHDNQEIIKEIARMNKKNLQYDVQPVGHMTNDKEDGRVRVFFG